MLTKFLICSLFPCALFANLDEAFTVPGIIVLKENKWVGGEHLFNLNNKIQIYIELQKSEGITDDIDTNQIKGLIETVFKANNIVAKAESNPPFPFFHMLIMILPIEKGYALMCEGRLFEVVHLDRFVPDRDMMFQGITWEKQLLLIAPKNQLNEEIAKAVNEIASNFATRFSFFEGIKARQSQK